MNLKKTVAESLKNKQFRYAIVVIVILSVISAFTEDAVANHHHELDTIIIPSVPIAHAIPPQTPPILYTVIDEFENNLYIEETHPDEYCIALNIYYEARAENLAGKYAVADVVLNRANDSRFPSTVCEVIREGVMYESWATRQHADLSDEERIYFPKLHQCQFSWFCDGMADTPDQPAAWRDAQVIAYNIVQFGTFRGITEGATHYHATYVNPNWSLEEWRPIYQLIGRIGAHIFYRWV